jgi:hypothetical protein
MAGAALPGPGIEPACPTAGRSRALRGYFERLRRDRRVALLVQPLDPKTNTERWTQADVHDGDRYRHDPGVARLDDRQLLDRSPA